MAKAAGDGDAGRARGLRRAGRNEEAAAAYRRYLKRTPDDAGAWRGLGLSYISLRRLEDAAYCYWQALKYRSTSLRLIMQLGDILVQTGDLERAVTVFKYMIKEHPSDARGFLSLSAVQRELGQVDLAGRTLRSGVGKSPITVLSSLRAPDARILRLRGVQNAYYSVASEGSHWLRLRGGNFSSSALWDQGRFTTINFLIADENILNFDSMPSHQVVVNSIADADLEGRSLRAAAKYLAGNPATPVINDPIQVLNSTRDNNHQRLKDTPGVRFPKTLRLDWRPEAPFNAAKILSREGMALPVILRRTGTHTAVSTTKAATISEVESYFAAAGAGEYYVIEYVLHPFRGDYFRKMRVFFIDGEIYPVVHHVDTVWNVHGFNRTTVMAATPWMQELERAYLDDPAAFVGAGAYAALKSLYAIAKLDFFGVDFDILDDGRILIFEMNPAMRHSFEHAQNFPYLMPHAQRITDAFQAMITTRALPMKAEKPNTASSADGSIRISIKRAAR